MPKSSTFSFPFVAAFWLLLITGCGAETATHFAGTSTANNASSSTTPVTPASNPTATPTPAPAPPPTPSPTPSTPTVPGHDLVLSMPFQAGITHVNGRYGFVKENFLLEGAQKIVDLGSSAIFVYMTPGFRSDYPDRGSNMWPAKNPDSLTELAKTAPFQKVFNMPFKTIVITANTFANNDNLANIYSNPAAAAAEEQEFYDLAKYLLTTYSGSGKVFILKHWEGDFIGLQGFDSSQNISPQMVKEMITWLKPGSTGLRGRVRMSAARSATWASSTPSNAASYSITQRTIPRCA